MKKAIIQLYKYREVSIKDFDISKLNNWILNALVETGRKGT